MEKSVNSLPVDKFKYGTDHFESWIKLFEAAIDIAYKGATADERLLACRQWLPLKLDEQARLVYSNVTGNTWAEIKENLRKALIDPQEEYNWHAKKATIVWDGVESFQSLATRVKRAVDTHHRENREVEYYFRFLLALPLEYKRPINRGLPKDMRTIENAVDVAERVRIDDTDAEAPSATPAPAPRSVTFSGAAMSDDRIKSLEMAFEGMTVEMGELKSAIRKDNNSNADAAPLSRRDEARREFSSSRDRGSRYRDQRSDSYSRGRRDSSERDRRREPSRESRRDERDRYRGHDDDRYRSYDDDRYRDRGRRDSYDRRDYQDRGRRRDSYDRRDRYQSPGRRGSSPYYRGQSRSRPDSRNRYEDQRNSWGRRESWDRNQGNGYRSAQNSYRSPHRDGQQYGNNGQQYGNNGQQYGNNGQHYGNNGQQYNNNGQQYYNGGPNPYRAAEFNNVDWLCQAIAEKRDRDQASQGN